MKSKRILMVAFVAMLGMGVVSCEKENSTTNGNGGDNPSGGGNTPAGWVDLGLPSGLLWAECNLGANVPEEYGDYYAWGETSTKDIYRWSTYKYCTVDGEGNLQTLTKYNTRNSYGTPDNKTTLEAVDDAAMAALGTGARTPTKEEWEELINNTTVKWTTLNGVNGREFTSANGNTLFLPAAGCRYGSECDDAFVYGYYWSSSLDESYPNYAWLFRFDSGDQIVFDYYRSHGFSVRAVSQD